MTRSKKKGKADRTANAIRRAHRSMMSWYTRKDIFKKACKDAEAADQPRPSMTVGKEPAPVVHFIPKKDRDRGGFCKGHHVLGVECELV